MRLQVGPFDPALHIRSRDHHRAICREAALLDLPPGSLPRRWEAVSTFGPITELIFVLSRLITIRLVSLIAPNTTSALESVLYSIKSRSILET